MSKNNNLLKNNLTFRNIVFRLFRILNITARRFHIPLLGYSSSEKIISEKHRFICITIPLCGRSTLLDLFKRYFTDFYITKKPLSRLLKRNPEYNKYFKFTIIRNPWSRTVSCYNKRIVNANTLRKIYLLSRFEGLNPDMRFEDFTGWLNTREGSDRIADKHWQSPHKFLMDSKGIIRCDYVGKLENINKDLEAVFNKIGLRFSEKWIRKVASSENMQKKPAHKDYRKYYNSKTRELVKKRYKDYIKWSGYSFSQQKP